MPEDGEYAEDLLSRARDGDRDAREALIVQMESSVRALVRRRMGRRLRERMDSADVAQSAFGDALRDLGQFEDPGASDDRGLRGWLMRLVENKVRKKGRALQVGDRDPDRVKAISAESGAITDPPPNAGASGALTRLVRQEERHLLRAAIESLPEREQLLIRLRDVRGLSWPEIVAATEEPSRKAAQSCYARGMARLVAKLGEP